MVMCKTRSIILVATLISVLVLISFQIQQYWSFYLVLVIEMNLVLVQ